MASAKALASPGGTILGTSNRGNPFAVPIRRPDGTVSYEDHETGFDISVDNAHGISIYFPDPKSFDDRYLRSNDFARMNKWGLFLQALSSGQLP